MADRRTAPNRVAAIWNLGIVLVPAGVFATVPAVACLEAAPSWPRGPLRLYDDHPSNRKPRPEGRWLHADGILWSSWPEASSWAPP
jgi:hypothetical protein